MAKGGGADREVWMADARMLVRQNSQTRPETAWDQTTRCQSSWPFILAMLGLFCQKKPRAWMGMRQPLGISALEFFPNQETRRHGIAVIHDPGSPACHGIVSKRIAGLAILVAQCGNPAQGPTRLTRPHDFARSSLAIQVLPLTSSR